MSPLATPVTFARSGKVAPTATLKSAMTERLCTYDQDNLDERGKPTPEYEHLYKVWGEGKIGVIVLGNIPIDREGLEAKKNAIIDARSPWDPVAAFKPVIAAAKAHGSLVIGQLTHGGRQVSEEVTKTPVSSSDLQCPPLGGMTFAKPRPLTVSEIDGLVKAWGYGAKVLYEAGADGAQMHSAHGYLLSQFLSGRVNQRTDDYGGTLENRFRIVKRVVEEMRRQVPDEKFILSIKINSADFSDGGLTLEESRQVCIWLDEMGLDLIELSGGTYESMAFEHKKESTKAREGYFVEFSEAIRPHIKTAKLAVTGGFRSKKAMDDAIEKGVTDILGLARPLTAEPHLIRDMIDGKTQAARDSKMPPALSTGASIMQIGNMSRGEPIADLNDEKVVQEIVAALTGQAPEKKQGQETSSYEKSENKL
ncbi:NADH:flavin oxidoreductase/NADH oxidase family protein [Rhodotorula paludigena]|uniref:NADH:flavin oxidoreductase/NADH oxidase family protein n=1 Tax=Rhodotorula paludigena TaxID=86838 RepID=UPI0031754619